MQLRMENVSVEGSTICLRCPIFGGRDKIYVWRRIMKFGVIFHKSALNSKIRKIVRKFHSNAKFLGKPKDAPETQIIFNNLIEKSM